MEEGRGKQVLHALAPYTLGMRMEEGKMEEGRWKMGATALPPAPNTLPPIPSKKMEEKTNAKCKM
jgi:hypothetical protein